MEINFLEPCLGIKARTLLLHTRQIAVAYEGGLDKNGHPADTRTEAQKITLEELLYSLAQDYPDATILGHRDLPGVKKECPCFDTKAWLKEIDFHL